MADLLDTQEFTIPTWAVYGMYYGINEDDSLTIRERNQITDFISENNLKAYVLDFQDDEHFTWSNDLTNEGATCVTLIARLIG